MATSFNSRSSAYHAPVAAPNAPPGTFAPGTKVQVGDHRVVIEKYLSEGGFAHVYVVRVPRSGDKYDIAVLKRVAVPDKEALANMRTEVETMKKLKGHKHIVTYIDSHASQLKGGGYEVFLLMEYCQGGGLIDFMNTRLQHRLTEPEILKIFSDVAEGVATMHFLKPPLLHRDLKVENVLISTSGSTRLYKLCDFGSTAPPRPAATSAAEARLIEDDVQRHTTLQYRSPEMIDVYRKLPIDEKSDIWALGVLLYKLCYYTTPFEDQGQMAILNASFKYPTHPSFSDRLKRFIGSMLKESPKARPNIYQVVAEVCSMRNTPIPIKDIYAHRTHSEARKTQQLPSPESVASPPIVGISKAAPVQPVQTIPDIAPMRRGRPTGPTHNPPGAKPSPSPMGVTSGDPFAALDSTSQPVRAAAADELAARFPSLDEFSLLHDKGSKFQFSQTSPVEVKQEVLTKRVTQALADEAFAKPSPPLNDVPIPSKSQIPAVTAKVPAAEAGTTQAVESRAQPTARREPPRRTAMVSTAVGASPPASPKMKPAKLPEISKRPVWRVPADGIRHHDRTLSQPRIEDDQKRSTPALKPELTLPPRPSLTESHRSKSQLSALSGPRSPASSRPSLEGSRPSALDLNDSISRSKSANARPRPTSLHIESNLDYLRDRETRPSIGDTNRPRITSEHEVEPEENNIASDVDFLRSIEGEDSSKKKDRRSSSGNRHSKRSSIPSISLSGTKNILAGRFGEAFRRFESNQPTTEIARTPSPSFDRGDPLLSPITGSEATNDDDGRLDETQELSPEVRRELERRRLEQEEERVASAAADYQKRLASGKSGQGITRATTIQNRVRSLLDESKQQPPPARTAEGYGRFTATPQRPEEPSPRKLPPKAPAGSPYAKGKPFPPTSNTVPIPSASAPPAISSSSVQRSTPRPNAPPKPKAFPTGGAARGQYEVPAAALASRNSSAAPPSLANQRITHSEETAEWDEAAFASRYPSLSGLEMVETEIGTGTQGRIRDV